MNAEVNHPAITKEVILDKGRKVKDWNHLLDQSVKPKTKLSYMKHYKDFMRHHCLKLGGRVEAFTQEELQQYSDHLDRKYKDIKEESRTKKT